MRLFTGLPVKFAGLLNEKLLEIVESLGDRELSFPKCSLSKLLNRQLEIGGFIMLRIFLNDL